MKRRLIIRNGKIHFVYDDGLKPLMDLGKAHVRRASHVEPHDLGGKVAWSADLSPVGGPVLGPFGERKAAIGAELEWLNVHLRRSL